MPAGRAAVRSGLAHRRNPALVKLGEFASGARRLILRDPLSLFLLIASIVLAIAFATLLGDIKPSSSGLQVPISTVQTLASKHDIASAVLLDHDNRVEVSTSTKAPAISAIGALPSRLRPRRRSSRTGRGKHARTHTVTIVGPAAGRAASPSCCGPPTRPRAR